MLVSDFGIRISDLDGVREICSSIFAPLFLLHRTAVIAAGGAGRQTVISELANRGSKVDNAS